MKRIETLENWNILAAALKEKGYSLWQMQYSYTMHEGFHAWYMEPGKSDVEVVTHNEMVQKAIIAFNDK